MCGPWAHQPAIAVDTSEDTPTAGHLWGVHAGGDTSLEELEGEPSIGHRELNLLARSRRRRPEKEISELGPSPRGEGCRLGLGNDGVSFQRGNESGRAQRYPLQSVGVDRCCLGATGEAFASLRRKRCPVLRQVGSRERLRIIQRRWETPRTGHPAKDSIVGYGPFDTALKLKPGHAGQLTAPCFGRQLFPYNLRGCVDFVRASYQLGFREIDAVDHGSRFRCRVHVGECCPVSRRDRPSGDQHKIDIADPRLPVIESRGAGQDDCTQQAR